MLSILTQTLQDENFIEQIKDVIVEDLIGDTGIAFDSRDGSIEGTVTEYSITSDPVFNNPNNHIDGLEWSINLEFIGDATISYINSDGEEGKNVVSGLCNSTIRITFPSNTLAAENIKDIISSIELEVVDISASLEAENPIDELKNGAVEREVDLHSMSHDELVSEVKALENEIARLKKRIAELES